MAVRGAGRQITATVSKWEGVQTGPHRFGGTEYQLGTREFGHIHGDHMVDIPFPKGVRNEVVTQGLAQPHHILPDTGWVSFYIREPSDVARAIELLHRSYALAVSQKDLRSSSLLAPGNDHAE